MENSLVTYGFNKDRERIEHLTRICDQLCTVFRKNIIGNVTAKNYLKERLSSILCLIIQGKVLHGSGLILKFSLLQYCAYLTRPKPFAEKLILAKRPRSDQDTGYLGKKNCGDTRFWLGGGGGGVRVGIEEIRDIF